MENNSINVLSVTAPPAKKHLVEMTDLNGRIAVLQNQLGLPYTLPTLNQKLAQARLTDLQNKAAQKSTTSTALAVSAAKAGAGALSQADFAKLSAAAKMAHFKALGTILPGPEVSRYAPGHPPVTRAP
jgi:hypothetical protein